MKGGEKMLSVKEKGLEELQDFKNRLARTYGMDKISKKDFEKADKKVNELIEIVKKIDEKE